MTADRNILIPALFSETQTVDGNRVRQLLVPEQSARLVEAQDGRTHIKIPGGRRLFLARSGAATTTGPVLQGRARDVQAGLEAGDLSFAKWSGAPHPDLPADVIATWRGAFSVASEDVQDGRQGLRRAQVGALYAVIAHWTTGSTVPGTVVMPTGTGKTETMLALLVAERLSRLLVVVPSDALRQQTVRKFETLGILQPFGLLQSRASLPVVGIVEHGFHDGPSAQAFADQCNVVVATPAALTASSPEVRSAFLSRFSHLFVDEAHHVAAATWQSIRDEFDGRPVVQFTATPFREDGRHLGGKLLYAFPLGEAQKDGYFAEISLVSVLTLDDPDRAIAERAIRQLRQDLDEGLDHLLMARVRQISRAQTLIQVYEGLAPDLKPVVIHSQGSATQRRQALELVRAREARIIVCVDMLGEGFDLPSLKVAAIHDPHKSLGITLQFVGRFARAGAATLGSATVVVGRPAGEIDPTLRRLYAEDADWNKLIKFLAEGAVDQATEASDFEAAFGATTGLSIRSILPKMSTVVYRMDAGTWDIAKASDPFPAESLLAPIAVNERDHVAWFVAANRVPVQWGELESVEEVTYTLYVLFWNAQQQLLYINSSDNASLHEELAKAVGGSAAQRIVGEDVYRVMGGLDRLVPTNVGLLDFRNRSRRFSMHVGADVIEGFPAAEAQTKTKTNIFASGYQQGTHISIGASLKGRIWSHRVAQSVREWMDWCSGVGDKLLDATQSVDEVMAGFIKPEVVEHRPPLVPLALEWPWELQSGLGEVWEAELGGQRIALADLDLQVDSTGKEGPIAFTVSSPQWQTGYLLQLENGEMTFSPTGPEVQVHAREKEFALSQFLHDRGVYVHFEQEALVVPPALLLKPPRDLPPFDRTQLSSLDWSGIKLNVESRGQDRRTDSIQHRMIEVVRSLDAWDVVLDDDGSGEVADIVALRVDGRTLKVHLTHCKWVHGGAPRAQVEDLYQVCGQAQKSARWRRGIPKMLERLRWRERQRLKKGKLSGFIVGDAQALYRLEDAASILKPEMTISIAQPGLAKQQASVEQLELLASTETYVKVTANAGFTVYCSETT